jgi:hypothetical protein
VEYSTASLASYSGRSSGGLKRLILALVFVLCLLPLSAFAKTRPRPVSRPLDAEYVSALATANRFLQAWQAQDHEAGLLLLTDAAKQHTSEDRLDEFFSPGESAGQAFEITRGKRLRAGRYEFPVALWQTIPGKNRKPTPHFSTIVVVRTGKDDWAIDKLP